MEQPMTFRLTVTDALGTVATAQKAVSYTGSGGMNDVAPADEALLEAPPPRGVRRGGHLPESCRAHGDGALRPP